MTVDRRLFLGLLTGGGASAAADQALDVQLLQTAASVENVLVSAYDTLLGLALFTGSGANPVLKNLLTVAKSQHTDHATACNEIAGRFGGKAQTAANPALAQAVTQARPGLGDLGNALELAVRLETASTQTYQNAVALLTDVNARRLAAMIMAIEAQHVGLLLVAKGLVGVRAGDLVSLESGTPGRLPADAAKAGFPDSFSKLDEARPPGEGAVK